MTAKWMTFIRNDYTEEIYETSKRSETDISDMETQWKRYLKDN